MLGVYDPAQTPAEGCRQAYVAAKDDETRSADMLPRKGCPAGQTDQDPRHWRVSYAVTTEVLMSSNLSRPNPRS